MEVEDPEEEPKEASLAVNLVASLEAKANPVVAKVVSPVEAKVANPVVAKAASPEINQLESLEVKDNVKVNKAAASLVATREADPDNQEAQWVADLQAAQ